MSTPQAITAQSPTLDPPEAFEMLGISDWLGYRQIREGTFPAPIIRVGRKIRVPRAPLERLLGLDIGPDAA
jgi:predicted DNA-binding transcriptional regulator AlpA